MAKSARRDKRVCESVRDLPAGKNAEGRTFRIATAASHPTRTLGDSRNGFHHRSARVKETDRDMGGGVGLIHKNGADVVDHVFKLHGLPLRVISDRGTQFTSLV